MTTRSRWILAVLALIALWVALWPRQRVTPPTVVAESTTTVSPTTTAPQPVPAPATLPTLTEADLFDLQYRLTLDVPDGQARKVGTVALKGTLEQTAAAGQPWVAARLTQATLDLDEAGRSLTDFSATPGQDVQTTWLQGAGKDGRVTEVRFQPGVRLGARGLLAGIVKAVQFAQPAEPTAQTWQADETDVNGAYRATYTRQPDGSVQKTFQAQVGDRLPGAPRQPGYKLASMALFHWQDGHLQDVQVTQKGEMEMGVPGKADRIRYETTVTLQRRGTASSPWAKGLQPGKFQTFEATAAASTAERQVLASYDELLAAAAKAGEASNVADRTKVANDLAQKLAQEPALVAKVEQQLRTGVARDAVERTLVEALVRADTAPARQALVDLAADRDVKMPLRERVLQGAVFVPTPDAAFTAGLTRLAFDTVEPAFGGMAAMTLGAALARQPDAGHDVQKMAEHTQALLATAKVTHDVCNWLAALGNTGARESLPPLLQALTDERERVRVSAALALRFQDPAAVLPAMQKAMLTDDSIHVRDNLLQAARFLGPDALLPLVQKALLEDRNEFVRMGAANTIAAWALDAPALDAVLQAALTREPSAKVRESLKNYLEPGRVAPPFQLVKHGGKSK